MAMPIKSPKSKKRRLSSDFDAESPPTKQMRYNEVTASVVANINKIVEDDRTNDVTFIVGTNDDTKHIHGNKLLFAAQSDVLANMLYGHMEESKSKEIFINDVTKEAFEYIKEIVHLSSPSLQYQHVVDVLYAAKKYMISSIVKQCKQTILAIDDVNTFYLIMNSIGKYAPSTFESLLTDIMKSTFVVQRIHDIIHESEKLNSLKIFQIKLLIKLIDDEFTKYKKVKSFCKAYVASINEHKIDDDNVWQKCFLLHFLDCIHVKKFTLNELMNDIRSDQVISEFELLDLVHVKIEELQSKCQRLNELNQNKNKGNKTLTQQNTNLKEKNTKLTADNTYLGEKNKKLKTQKTNLQKKCYSLQREIENLKSDDSGY